MIHVLYEGDVRGGEAIKGAHVKPLAAYRVKTKSGRYYHVLADSADAVKAWVKDKDGAASGEGE